MRPGAAGAWIALGQLDERSLAWDGARRGYMRALDADPDSAEALFRHARACLGLGRRQEAGRSTERLFERHQGSPAAGWLRGRLLLADGDRPGAREALRLLLARPDADPALSDAARSLLRSLGSSTRLLVGESVQGAKAGLSASPSTTSAPPDYFPWWCAEC